MAGAGTRLAEHVGTRGKRRAEAAQQRGALVEPNERIAGRDLEVLRQRRGLDPSQRVAVAAPWRTLIGREGAGTEHCEAGDRQPFGAPET